MILILISIGQIKDKKPILSNKDLNNDHWTNLKGKNKNIGDMSWSRVRYLVTGGCGFIGNSLLRRLIHLDVDILNIDKLTYASTEYTPDDKYMNKYHLKEIDIIDDENIIIKQ